MRMRGSLKGLVVGLLLLSSLSWARLDEPHQVQELAYGEVAYLYLKGDYFAALTRAQMALERGEVDIHKADMEVLLGAMYSAYPKTPSRFSTSCSIPRSAVKSPSGRGFTLPAFTIASRNTNRR